MKKTILILAAGILVAATAGASAQKITRAGQKNDWGLYNYTDQQGKVCYALSVPKEMQPSTLDHGKKMYFVVSHKPGQNVAFEPQFNASYDFQQNSKVEVTVGDKTFVMFTQGNRAWMDNAAEEPQLIAAMRAGADMKVAAKSGRGNPTSYVFSLKGITAALQELTTCK